MAKTNRNQWSAKETMALNTNLRTCSSKKEAFEKTAKQLGRSYDSCVARHYKQINQKANKTVISNKKAVALGTTFKFNIRSVRVKNNQLIITL